MSNIVKSLLIAAFISCAACSKGDNAVMNPEPLPMSASVAASGLSAPVALLGPYMSGASARRIEIGEYEDGMPEIRLRTGMNSAIIAVLKESSGAGELFLSDANRWSEARYGSDNLSLGFNGGSRVGLYAGPVNSGLLVDGKRIVGPQGGAVEDATNPDDAVLKLNQLLSELRRHGLIASGNTQLASGR